MSRSTHTVNESSNSESQTASSTTPPSSAISEHSSIRGTPQAIREWLMSLQPAPHASHSPSPANSKGPTTSGTCGLKRSLPFASYDRDTSSWKMSQVSLLPDTSGRSLATLPRAGMMRGGTVYQRQPLAPITRGTGCGLLPTPCSADSCGGRGYTLDHGDKTKPREALTGFCRRLSGQSGGRINAEFHSWMMGLPYGATGLEQVETARFRQWLALHGACWDTDQGREET